MGNCLNANDSNSLSVIKKESVEARAHGCILGAFITDACGSYLEFTKHVADEETMDICMTMPGGGPHMIGPGQITDDSE